MSGAITLVADPGQNTGPSTPLGASSVLRAWRAERLSAPSSRDSLQLHQTHALGGTQAPLGDSYPAARLLGKPLELEPSLDWPLWAGRRLPPAVGIALLADRWSPGSLLNRRGHCQAVGLYMVRGGQSLGSGALGGDTGGDTELWWVPCRLEGNQGAATTKWGECGESGAYPCVSIRFSFQTTVPDFFLCSHKTKVLPSMAGFVEGFVVPR